MQLQTPFKVGITSKAQCVILHLDKKKGFVYIIHFKYKVLMCHVTTKSAEMLYSGGQELGLRLHCVL